MEILKFTPEEFGGIQFESLTLAELALRMCAFRGCSLPGMVQVPQPRLDDGEPASWRILCNKHLTQMVYVMDAFLGSPSPGSEAARFVEGLGLPGSTLDNFQSSAASLFNPRFARCVECGGSFVAETIGMFSGKRYVHTCGDPK